MVQGQSRSNHNNNSKHYYNSNTSNSRNHCRINYSSPPNSSALIASSAATDNNNSINQRHRSSAAGIISGDQQKQIDGGSTSNSNKLSSTFTSLKERFVTRYYESMLTFLRISLRNLMQWITKLCHCITYVLKKETRKVISYQTVRYEIVPLSPLTRQRLSMVQRKTLVLDLDETLIHSHHDGIIRPMVKPGTPPDFILKVTIDHHPVRFFVHKRPHVDYFLSIVNQWFDLVVFTASMEIYGTAVADKLDRGKGMLNRRYFRQHCTMDYTGYSKDLASINPDLRSVFILDNSPGAYRQYPENAIPIRSWFSDPTDTALLNLLPFLDALRMVSDVRSLLSRNIQIQRVIEKSKMLMKQQQQQQSLADCNKKM